jgi:hypothetical protein
MPIVGKTLFEVNHPLLACGFEHSFTIRAINPESCGAGHIVPEFLEAFLRVSLATVHGKHSPTAGATKGRMFRVVVETDDVARLSLKRSGRHICAADSPVFGTVIRLVL